LRLKPDYCKLPVKHIQKVGFSSILRSRYKDNFTGEVPCPWYDRFVQSVGRDPIRKFAEYTRSIETEERFLKSFMKCDVPIKLPDENDILWKTAQEYTKKMFFKMGQCRPVESFQLNDQTSCGRPYTSMGYKTKGDLMNDPKFYEELKRDHVPIWSVCGKGEYLPKEDVLNDKLRTYFIPDLPFLVHQKMLFDDQNRIMLENCLDFENFWPRYGFVKQYGGFHDLMSFHEEEGFDVHCTTDITGWDRVNATMKKVYEQRVFFLKGNRQWPPIFEKHVEYVVDNTVQPYCCLPDGSIYRRLLGNGSGSNDTTTDNCWSHVMIMFYVLLRTGMVLFERILTYDEIIFNTRVSIYGDDNFFSFRSKFWFPHGPPQGMEEQIKNWIREGYEMFNMIIKERAFDIKFGRVEGLEFLGSTAYWSKRHNMYLPKPRIGKLCTSITQVLDQKLEIGVATSILAFYQLVSDIDLPEEQEIRKFLIEYAQFLIRERGFCEKVEQCDLYNLELIASERLSTQTLTRGYEAHVPRNVDIYDE